MDNKNITFDNIRNRLSDLNQKLTNDDNLESVYNTLIELSGIKYDVQFITNEREQHICKAEITNFKDDANMKKNNLAKKTLGLYQSIDEYYKALLNDINAFKEDYQHIRITSENKQLFDKEYNILKISIKNLMAYYLYYRDTSDEMIYYLRNKLNIETFYNNKEGEMWYDLCLTRRRRNHT